MMALSTTDPTALADHQFFGLGIQYYVAGRQAVLAGLLPIPGNLFHHAVEMLLKGQLAKKMPLKKIGRKYGHNLKKTWTRFKAAFPGDDLAAFDELVAELDKFEDIRYPDKTLEQGAAMSIGWGTQLAANVYPPTLPCYEISMPALDAFIARLFGLLLNPVAYMGGLSKEAKRAIETDNACCRGWFS